MANVSYRVPSQVEGPECRERLEDAIEAGKPGPEFQSIRSHALGVMRSFTREWIYHEGFLEFELKELVRAYIALSGDCAYCSRQGVTREYHDDQHKLDDFLGYRSSDQYTHRQKLAMRYADAIMWDRAEADGAMWEEPRAEFSEPEVVELGYWIGFTCGGQRWLKTLGSTRGQLQDAIEAAGADVLVTGHSTLSD